MSFVCKIVYACHMFFVFVSASAFLKKKNNLQQKNVEFYSQTRDLHNWDLFQDGQQFHHQQNEQSPLTSKQKDHNI